MSQRALNTRNNMTIMQWLTCLVSPLLVTNEPMLSTRKLSTPRVQKHRAEKQRRREKRLAQARRRNEKRRDEKRRRATQNAASENVAPAAAPPKKRRRRGAASPKLSASERRDAVAALEVTCRRVPRRPTPSGAAVPTTALLIEPMWLEPIFAGEKTIELRPTNSLKR